MTTYQTSQDEKRARLSSLHIQHQWPILGKEFFGLEQRFSVLPGANQRQLVLQEKLRQHILAQVYQAEGQYPRSTRYLAFLVVRYGRGAEIVGNPFHVQQDGRLQALPYTGLEGYYAGSELSDEYPGLSKSAILQEEAELGWQVLKKLKKDAIEHDTWMEYAHIRHTLERKEQSLKAFQTIQRIWISTLAHLRTRVYHNPEFELTITELLEQEELMDGSRGSFAGEAGEHFQYALQEEWKRLNEAYAALSETRKAQEKSERQCRECLRRKRLEAWQRFRHETYMLLEQSNEDCYEVGIQGQATILEKIALPGLPPRERYPTVEVHFTPEELDGYLFLSQLGEFGSDPLLKTDLG